MKLKEWLAAKNITQSDLARQLGMSRDHVHVVVNGKVKPGRRFVDVIVAYTNGEVTAKDFGMEGYKPNKIIIARPKKNVIDL